MGLGFCGAISTIDVASAQIALPAAKSPDGAALFKQQCATCQARAETRTAIITYLKGLN
jgi:cytochrome c